MEVAGAGAAAEGVDPTGVARTVVAEEAETRAAVLLVAAETEEAVSVTAAMALALLAAVAMAEG